MVDYARAQQNAQRLIEENGRSFDLLRDATGAANPSEPERGPSFTGGPAEEASVIGVFVPASGSGLGQLVTELGGKLLRGFDEVVLIATLTLEDETATPIGNFDRVRDGAGNVLKIDRVDVLGPGPLEILYQLGLVR